MPVTTTSDFRTWYIDDRIYTTQEVKDYVDNLEFATANHVRTMAIIPSDKVVVVNGLPVIFAELEGGRAAFDTALGAYTENNNYPIHSMHYYADRDHVELEYAHHPCDPKPPNTRHSSSELGTVLSDCFDIWKTEICDAYYKRLQQEASAATFALADGQLVATGITPDPATTSTTDSSDSSY